MIDTLMPCWLPLLVSQLVGQRAPCRIYLHVISLVGVPVLYLCCIWGRRPPVLMAGFPLSPPAAAHFQLNISDLLTWSPKSLSRKIFLQCVSDREEPPRRSSSTLIYLIYLLTCTLTDLAAHGISRYLWGIVDLHRHG